MKKVYLIIVLSFVLMGLQAQDKRYYCEVKGAEKAIGAGLKIVFDFGNNPIYTEWGGLKSNQQFVDENGKEIPFNSMVDAGNYMSAKGWSFLQAYTSSYGSTSIIHWIFYKDAESPDKAVEGIMTVESYRQKNKGK
ncbi:MAG: hypothetical protein J5698_02150 [Bacteroidaceae bacterium]|nr:hypothetical protein [Bacteroidaceae bacterium]MBO4589759.1 hypothetical protein [Bacteroidaceae bacterium]